MPIDFDLYSFLSFVTITLLFFITIGVVYITYIDWKDKKRSK